MLERWQRERTFARSVEQRAGAPLYAFDDGPPFATGLPHYGHIVTSYMKDVVPRYGLLDVGRAPSISTSDPQRHREIPERRLSRRDGVNGGAMPACCYHWPPIHRGGNA